MALTDIELASLKVVRYPDPALLNPAGDVTEFGPALEALARRMLEIMYAAKGVGLAAPQVGVPLRLFVTNPSGDPKQPDQEAGYANPVIVECDGERADEEGCLSVPDVHTKIKRYNKVRVRAQTLAGQPVELEGEGLLARIFQHEIDHLNGVVLVKRMSTVAKLAHRRTLKELEEKYGQGQTEGRGR